MLYSYKEVMEKYKSAVNLKKALNLKKVFKLEYGVYSDTDIVNPICIYSKKYPNAVVTMDSALYYYGLTDVIPNKVYLATSRSAVRIKNDKIVQIFVSNETLNQGKIQINIDGNIVNIYDKERLLIEVIRKKKQIPYDYYKEIILNYREISYDLDMYKIEEYLSLYKFEVGLGMLLKNEVF